MNSFYFVQRGFLEFPPGSGNQAASIWRKGPVMVLVSHSLMKDGTLWKHVSVSCQDREPTWRELVRAKEEFIGRDLEAVMVLPKRSDHINIMKYCFHWWALLEGELKKFPNLQDLEWEKAPT